MQVSLVLEQTLLPVPGGTGRYSRELAAALARTAPQPSDRVQGYTAWHRDLSPARVPGVAGPVRLTLPRRALIAAWERGVGPRPGGEVVHAPTLLLPPRPDVPLVVTIHDVVPWTHPQTLTPRGVQFHLRMAARAAQQAALVTVPTQAVANQLVEVLPELAGRIAVLPPGISSAFRVPVQERECGLSGLPEQFILAVGTLEPRKGIDVLISALGEGPLARGRIPLLLVGPSGWGGVEVSELVTRARVDPDRVRALGHVSDAQLAALMKHALLLAAPSRAEGFGLPIAEAMAVGTPVVCSDDPAQVEVAGDAAVIVARGDPAALSVAVAELIDDPDRRRAMAAAGRARSQAFDWDTSAAQLWGHYLRLAQRA